jgi:hypothetical protein
MLAMSERSFVHCTRILKCIIEVEYYTVVSNLNLARTDEESIDKQFVTYYALRYFSSRIIPALRLRKNERIGLRMS